MRILDTIPGEDLMNPDFGCSLGALLFEQDTEVFRSLAETSIRNAVLRWEPRIAEVLEVEISRDDEVTPNQLDVRIFLRLIESQEVLNLVHPFYLVRGVDGF
jgi:uncharacterized protein